MKHPNLYVRQSDIRYIVPLLKCASFLGITPNFDFNKNDYVSLKWQRIYASVQAILLLAASIYGIQGRIQYEFTNYLPTIPLLAILRFFSYVLADEVMILATTFSYSDNFKTLLNNLMEIDFKIQKEPPRIYNQLYKELGITMILLAFLYFFDVYLIYSDTYIYVFIENVQDLYLFGFAVVIINFALVFRDRFKNLNDILIYQMNSIISSTTLKKPFISLDEIGKIYNKLCDTVDIFNEIYGLQTYLLITAFVIDLLHSGNILITKIMEDSSHNVPQSNIEDISKNLLFFCWTAIFWIFGVIIFRCCHKAAEEAEKTQDICDKYYHLLSDSKMRKHEKDRQRLLILSKHISQRPVVFSAGQFFTLDMTAIVTLATIIVPNFIIFVQFYQTFKKDTTTFYGNM